MKMVIHARLEAQRDETAVPIAPRKVGVAEQLRNRVGKALGLEYLLLVDYPELPDHRIARADQDIRVRFDGAGARLQFAHEAVVQAVERRFLRLVQAQVVDEQLPRSDREAAHQRILDLAEPSHEAGCRLSRDSVREQEVKPLGERQVG